MLGVVSAFYEHNLDDEIALESLELSTIVLSDCYPNAYFNIKYNEEEGWGWYNDTLSSCANIFTVN